MNVGGSEGLEHPFYSDKSLIGLASNSLVKAAESLQGCFYSSCLLEALVWAWQGLDNQNRAITGDAVAVEILPQAEWLSQRVTILRGVKMANQGESFGRIAYD